MPAPAPWLPQCAEMADLNITLRPFREPNLEFSPPLGPTPPSRGPYLVAPSRSTSQCSR